MAIHTRPSRLRLVDQRVPVLLRPIVRAYVLAYASSTVPRLLTLLLTYLSKKKRKPETTEHLISSLLRILRGGLEWNRFATFSAALVGGSTFLQVRHHV
jgi:hypothetical protein